MSQPVAIIRSIGGLVFDATFREHHESPAEVTENPCETGVSIADHMFLKPKRLTISAGVSDVLISSRSDDPFSGGTSRSQQAFNLLEQLQATFEPFDVQTGLKLYKSMVCANVIGDQDKDTSGVFIFDAELREAIIVSTQTVTIAPKAKGTTARQAGSTVSRGKLQGTQVIDAAVLAKLKAQNAANNEGHYAPVSQ
jgi:hypothetical protein